MKIIFVISYYWLTQVSKEQIGGFLRMLLGILGASLLGNTLTGERTIRAGEGTIRASENFNVTLSFN